MKPFKDTYVMYQLLEFINESSIICLCKAGKKLNKICKQYIELEDDKRFEIYATESYYNNSLLFNKYCLNNDVIKIRQMTKMDLDWYRGLYGACRGGHINIVNFLIEKRVDEWSWGLYGACKGGHMDIVKLMIEKGASDWCWGLWGACGGGHIDIVKLMIEKGATYCCNCKKPVKEHLS